MSDRGTSGVVTTSVLPERTGDEAASDRGWEFLARAAQVWTALPADADAHLVLGEQVRDLVGDCFVLVAAGGSPENTFRWRALVGDAPCLEEISGRLEDVARASAWPLPAPVRAALATRGLHDLPDGLRGLLAGQLPAAAADDLTAALGLKRVRALGLRWQDELQGLVVVLERADRIGADGAGPDPRVLVALVDLATVALQQRRAAQACGRAEERYQGVLDLIPGALLECDLTGRLTFVNRQTLAMTGYDEADVRAGLTLASFLVPEDRDLALASARNVMAGTPAYGNEYRAQRKDGTRYDLAVYSNPKIEAGRVTGMRGIGIDITQSTRARQAQEESDRRFRELLDLLPVGVVESDPAGTIRNANAYMTRMTGYTADDVRAGLRLMDLVVEGDRARVRARVADLSQGETHLNVEYTARHKDGSTSEVAIYASPMVRDGVTVGVRGVAIDITERKRTEEQQRLLAAREQQAQKLESLGVLTAGLAHDFNNLLIAMLGNAELALRGLVPTTPAFERVTKVHKVAQRAAELVNQLLTYSGGGGVDRRRIDVNEVVVDVESLVQETVARAGVLRLELASGLPPIEADAAQVRQIAMNLILNAAEAISEPPGRIQVRTGLAQADVELLARASCGGGIAPGPYVFLEVSDSGCGMDEATVHRMFEPFYTTKFAGRGLGLATVLGIVRGHGGAITVTTAPGQGSTITVLLPPAA
jgi:two-component system, cell cycle sensor histidine kinase and response regulator CckA